MMFTDTINKIKVHQLLIDNGLNNFSYIIENSKADGIIIDPVGIDDIEKVIKQRAIKPIAIINTHGHQDHIAGNNHFLRKNKIPVWASSNLLRLYRWNGHEVVDGDFFDQFEAGWSLKFFYTPGHTECGITLYAGHDEGSMVFSGDTLFAGGAGNCTSGGDSAVLHNSIKKIVSNCPESTVLYPGHNYLKRNLEFRVSLLGSSKVTNDLLDQLESGARVQTTIGLEKDINIFIQCDNPFVKKSIGVRDSVSSFSKLRELKDQF